MRQRLRKAAERLFGSPPSQLQSAFLDDLLILSNELADESAFEDRMERICFRTRSLLHCDRCSIFILEGDQYRARFNSGNPPDIAELFPNFRIPKDDRLISLAAEQRRAVTINNAPMDPLMPRETARIARIRAIVIAPIFGGDMEPRGFMTAEFNQTHSTFGRKETQLFEALTTMIGLSINHEILRNERTRAEELLQSANRLAALGRFAGGLARDFNNRLTAIVGISDLLIEKNRGTAIETDLEEIIRSVEGAAELSNQLLEMSNDKSKSEVGCDLAFAFRSIETVLRPLVPANINVTVDSSMVSAYVRLTIFDLTRILTSLVLNSVAACRPGGTIFVTLRESSAPLRNDSGTATADARAGGCLIEVADDGEGIPAETIESVTQPFFSTKLNTTGLGLSIVQTIVQDADGSIDIESVRRAGTTVRLTLPLSLPPIQTTPLLSVAPIDTQRFAERDPPTVLVVDDDDAVRRVLVRALSEYGCKVLSATNGRDALEVAAGASYEIDVLVTDLTMPEVGGIELAAALESKTEGLKVLFISAYGPPPELSELLGQEHAAFIAKPFGPGRLVQELMRLSDHSAVVH